MSDSSWDPAVRGLLDRTAQALRSVRGQWLEALALLPVPPDEEAMLEGLLPLDFATEARGLLECLLEGTVAPGVIEYDCAALGLCASISGARFRTTTEVYPDSPKATPAQCDDAQVAAVRAAIDFALAH